ncbi:hypothetical protein [Hymenobacter sp. BRD67]|uniref:hypothetical protein n=1 Tax=Hymenobacter sp. BRD67 TaxID=2675877 RepID=UPI001565A00B|nr:hypothetical protein [Hymenobacter sp. BRD67]QKG52267.1 hypothetical protein GKZ67_06105 [Hymenobacter sp. BRD67]
MEPTVYLAARAKKKEWAKNLDTACLVINCASAFTIFGARIVKNFTIFKLSLITLGAFTSIQIVLGLLSSKKWAGIYYPKIAEVIALNEQLLLIGPQEIFLNKLKSIVVNTDGYSGQVVPGRRAALSGNGKITVVFKDTGEEAAYLITVKSDDELKKLRQLSEAWRNQGLTAFIIN